VDFFIARQPILNRRKQLYAYELLYRGTDESNLANTDGDRATSSLLSTTFLTEGIEVISGSKPCFVNFSEELLQNNFPRSFSPDKIVVEVLEDVRPTSEVIESCRKLRKDGYRIALDDFIWDKSLIPLVEIAEIIKIDVRLTPLGSIRRTIDQLSGYKVKLLAEKVEFHEEFEKAKDLGFSYFQGYFFSRPKKILIKELVSSKVSLLHLLGEVTRESTTIERLHAIISKDVAISYKLLRFLNSAYFYRRQEVKNVKHAIAYLGEKELRSFLLLMIVSELAREKPGELTRLALVRAKFCELLALKSPLRRSSSALSMMGMFSLIDTMLDASMKDVMEKLPLSAIVKEALVYSTGEFAPFLDAVIAYERNQFSRFETIAVKNGIESSYAPDIYLQAMSYANGLS